MTHKLGEWNVFTCDSKGHLGTILASVRLRHLISYLCVTNTGKPRSMYPKVNRTARSFQTLVCFSVKHFLSWRLHFISSGRRLKRSWETLDSCSTSEVGHFSLRILILFEFEFFRGEEFQEAGMVLPGVKLNTAFFMFRVQICRAGWHEMLGSLWPPGRHYGPPFFFVPFFPCLL